MKDISNTTSRRRFLKASATLLGTYPMAGGLFAAGAHIPRADAAALPEVKLLWLVKPLQSFGGATCGVLWSRGVVKKDSAFAARDEQGTAVDLQSWPLAFWPDGSLKWTAHAFVGMPASAGAIYITPARKAAAIPGITVLHQGDHILIDTGVMQCALAKAGDVLIRSLARGNKSIAKDGRLVLVTQDQPDGEDASQINRISWKGTIATCVVEQEGPVRAVVKIGGMHRSTGETGDIIPFTVRLYFYHKSDSVRIVHTLVYNADADRQFIKGVGVTFDVPLTDKLYNRHVRFTNHEHNGVFAEAVQGLTGLRRDPGEAARNAQRTGQTVPPEDTFGPGVVGRMQYIPAFGDYTLFQGNDEAFTIRKRTGAGSSWLTSASGRRAAGLVYLGTPQGGIAVGIRNFWQSYPAQLDIRRAATELASVTAWLWAPEAAAMDMRFYHDGMGQDTFAKQREGLEITYEDYEPGFGTAEGVARTSELMLWALDKTPDNSSLPDLSAAVQNPPLLLCDTQHLATQKAFGGNWNAIDKRVPEKAKIEAQLEMYFDYYRQQIDAHHWYGFWHYGDVMHSYDSDRHTWRYDVGGFAWDNSELSTDLWLWYYFLHTGRTDVFRMAEAMTRHTGEVDVHHLGKFAPLGSRHNVLHWGCSAKQLRISTAANRRIFYYLTADERVGDLLDEQVEAAVRLGDVIAGRKLPDGGVPPTPPAAGAVSVGFGTDWGAIAAAWLTRWERTGNTAIRDRLLNSMRTIAAQPRGFFTGGAWLDVASGKFTISKDADVQVSHLSAVFGLTEICEELIALVDVPAFTQAWLLYCRLYNAGPDEQTKALGKPLSKLNLEQGHARLTAYAAYYLKDEALAKRAWAEFYAGKSGLKPGSRQLRTITGPDVLAPVPENTEVSTNAVAQWGLAALQCLAYVGDHIPKS